VKKSAVLLVLALLGIPYSASAASTGQAKLPLLGALLGGGGSGLGALPVLGKLVDVSGAAKPAALPGLALFDTSYKAQNAALPALNLNLNGLLIPLDSKISQFSLSVLSPQANKFLPQILLLPADLTNLLPGSPALLVPLAGDAFKLLGPSMQLVPVLTHL
jgi:hypothetical protein